MKKLIEQTMFEEEARNRARKLEESQTLGIYDNDEDYARDSSWNDGEVEGYEEGFIEGANFGYNKANEWHYVKDGKYPIDEKDVEVLYQDCDKTNVYNCIYDTHAKNWLYYNLDDMVLELFPFNVIAWKEIVLPELNTK